MQIQENIAIQKEQKKVESIETQEDIPVPIIDYDSEDN